uniref:Uncharacterized protein n=1 Tax=Nothobranchius korthausae TaxID=1143690 RepID=A0A1A8H648_9TELE
MLTRAPYISHRTEAKGRCGNSPLFTHLGCQMWDLSVILKEVVGVGDLSQTAWSFYYYLLTASGQPKDKRPICTQVAASLILFTDVISAYLRKHELYRREFTRVQSSSLIILSPGHRAPPGRLALRLDQTSPEPIA